MEYLLGYINNQWVISVGSGLISGIGVNFLTRKILYKKEGREYLQKVDRANSEIVMTLRSSVSEGVVPDRSTVVSVISSIGREYSVDKSDVHTIDTAMDDLVREIMASSFLQAAKKQELCENLLDMKGDTPTEAESVTTREHYDFVRYRYRMISIMSMNLAFMAFFTTVMLSSSKYPRIFSPDISSSPLIPATLAFSAAILTLLLTQRIRDLKMYKRKRRFSDTARSEFEADKNAELRNYLVHRHMNREDGDGSEEEND